MDVPEALPREPTAPRSETGNGARQISATDLPTLSTQKLLTLVRDPRLNGNERVLILQIAQERRSRLLAEVALAEELIASCRQEDGKQP
jgi:hypothetical protein